MNDDSRIAEFWSLDKDDAALCELCPHGCIIAPGKTGICGVRENQAGALIAAGYGEISSIALDPIEKKPLYLFYPGSNILSIGGFGCNLHCRFCQNYEISKQYRDIRKEARRMAPSDVIAIAVSNVPKGNIGVAYTYNEPFIGYEFVYDCSKLAFEEGLKNVLVTNGYVSKKPLESILPLIDAMNIDLKGFSSSFYENVGGSLEAVLETIALSAKRCHVEVTTLVIPGENEDDIIDISKWLAAIDPGIPLHLSRFFPRYLMSDREPTPRDTIYKLQAAAKKYLKNVFVGNM